MIPDSFDRVIEWYAREDGGRRCRAALREVILALPVDYILTIDCSRDGVEAFLPRNWVNTALDYFDLPPIRR